MFHIETALRRTRKNSAMRLQQTSEERLQAPVEQRRLYGRQPTGRLSVSVLRFGYVFSFSCFRARTRMEGILFCFVDKSGNIDNCISVYPFTAPVYKLVMEDYFLHAITETGLESYTVRVGHQLCRDLDVIDNNNLVN